MDKVRFGVIGLGNMGSHHVDYLNSVEGATLTAISDIDESKVKRFGERHNVKSFPRYEDLLESETVDAIIIATPHYHHPDIAKAAFDHDIHVLCEKPVAVTVGAARDLNLAKSKKPHLKFGLMYQTRTVPMYSKLREIVQSGELGDITRITWVVTEWFRTWTYYASGGWRATWAGEGGGVLLNQCPHNLDLLQWIPDMMPNRVTAVASLGKTHPIEVEDEVSAILEYSNGAIGHFITTTGEAPGSNRLEIAGDFGKIVADSGKLTFSRTRKSVRDIRENSPESFPSPETWTIDIPFDDKQATGHQVVTQNFVRAILHDEPLIARGEEGVRGLEIGNAMILSGLTHKSVELPLNADIYEKFIKENIAKYGGKKKLEKRAGTVTDFAASFKK